MSELHIVYGIVFLAIFMPIMMWRRESYVASEVPMVDWTRLPTLFKALWKPSYMLETTLGRMFMAVLPHMARRYAEFAEISGLPLTPGRVFVCKVILAPLFGGIGALTHIIPSVPSVVATVATCVLFSVGWMLPSLALSAAAQLRQEEIVRSLPFAIDLMGSAMRSGLDFGAAMRYYTTLGTGGALESEFSRVLRDASLGKPIAESLQDMAGRVRIKTFTAFAGVIAYGTEVGASIADTLKIHGAEMRRERFSLAEQKAARAPSVMIFPIAMFILPAVFLIIFVPVLLQFMATQSAN